MKKFLGMMIVAVILVSLASSSVFAGERFDDVTYKLGRGLTNIITSPIDVVATFDEKFQEYGPYKGSAYGLVRGVANGLTRLAIGVFEVLTFPFEVPENYGPILEPEFIFDKYRMVGSEY